MKRLSLFLVSLVLVSSAPALAGVSVDESKVLDRWTFRIGGYLTGIDTELRLDPGPGDRGTTINLEDDLGFDSSDTVPRLGLGVIIGKRHRISLTYFETKRDSSARLTEEIEFGDETFPVDVNVAAFYDTSFFELAYTYYFYTSETTALGVGLGLVSANLSAGIGVSLLGVGADLSDDLSSNVPIPQLGFAASHWLGKKFVLNGAVGYIAFDIDEYSGNVLGAGVSLEHRTWENFGFGLGWAISNYDVDSDDLDFLGKFEYRISGFEFYGRAAW